MPGYQAASRPPCGSRSPRGGSGRSMGTPSPRRETCACRESHCPAPRMRTATPSTGRCADGRRRAPAASGRGASRCMPLPRGLDPDGYLALARAVYAEMALAGMSVVGEFHYLHHAPGGPALRRPQRDGGRADPGRGGRRGPAHPAGRLLPGGRPRTAGTPAPRPRAAAVLRRHGSRLGGPGRRAEALAYGADRRGRPLGRAPSPGRRSGRWPPRPGIPSLPQRGRVPPYTCT